MTADGVRRQRAADPWLTAAGQRRSRPLSETLAAALVLARGAGVSRLADVTGLAPFGIPVFQAIRPLGLSLSVSQGKGLTPMAAKVSALLEAVESHVAERLPPPADTIPLAHLPSEVGRVWAHAARGDGALRLDPEVRRGWIDGPDLISGRILPVPWDLVSLDFTRPPSDDLWPSSVGLASGNTKAEATAGAVAELIEHDLAVAFDTLSPRERHAAQIDLATIDDPLALGLMRRIARCGFDVRVWSMGHAHGIAAFRAAIVARGDTPPPPAGGTGCHANRAVSLLRALLEAVQSHVTMVAGARDDILPDHYERGAERRLALIFGALSFGPGPMPWHAVPDHRSTESGRDLDILLNVAAARSPLPVVAIDHDSGSADIAVVRAIAPGLAVAGRHPVAAPPPRVPVPARVKRNRRPVVFVGPTLAAVDIPASIEARPPAVCGDIASLLSDPPPAVGLIDGCFETAPSVWHKEILGLVARGVPVLGAASLGALRAAELHGLGMIGVGAVFAAYRDGSIVRDDAVMVSHAPAGLGYQPATLALVDAEHVLRDAPLSAAERRMLQRIVRTTFFKDRIWSACLRTYAERTGCELSIEPRRLAAAPSIKRADALELIAALERGVTAVKPPCPVPLTAHYRGLLARLNSAAVQAPPEKTRRARAS